MYGDATNDWLFKKIFENGNILKGFLNEMLVPHGIPTISEVKYEPTHLLAHTQVGKECIIDVLCTDAKSGNQLILEMQVANTGNFTKRAQCYVSKAYIKHILKGKKERKKKKNNQVETTHIETESEIRKRQEKEAADKYKECASLKPVIFVAIIKKTTIFPNKEAYFSHHKTLDVATSEHDFKGHQYFILELEKFNKTVD